jgi:hypothetical protein
MIIKREYLRNLSSVPGLENYIKSNQRLVSNVYCTSIYFGDHQNYISWGHEKESDALDDMILRTINAACNTTIIFEDDDE